MNKSIDNKYWYAIYVRSRAEKKVYNNLVEIGIEAFLPLVVRVRQWSDRKKKIEDPLFHSYLFVRIDLKQDKYKVLGIDNVTKFVTFEQKQVVVPDNQIAAVKRYISDFVEEEENLTLADLKEGQLVRIVSGAMEGLTGRLSTIDNKRLVVLIESVGAYLPINISRSKVVPITKNELES